MNRRLDYTQIAPVGVKASHLSLRSQSDTIAALTGGGSTDVGENQFTDLAPWSARPAQEPCYPLNSS